eukprot:jgi/Chlat1/3384/Chrsp23S03811
MAEAAEKPAAAAEEAPAAASIEQPAEDPAAKRQKTAEEEQEQGEAAAMQEDKAEDKQEADKQTEEDKQQEEGEEKKDKADSNGKAAVAATDKLPKHDPVQLGPKNFTNAHAMYTYFHQLLHRVTASQDLNEYEYNVVLDLVKKGHHSPDEKLQGGVVAAQVRNHADFESRCFFLVKQDGTLVDFSYRKCINNLMPLPEDMLPAMVKGGGGGGDRGGRGYGGGQAAGGEVAEEDGDEGDGDEGAGEAGAEAGAGGDW